VASIAEQAGDAPAGSWIELETTNGFTDVAVTRAEHDQIVDSTGSEPFWGWGGPKVLMTSWSDAAYDPDANVMYFIGGGRTNYGGNEIYSFDFDTLAWTRLSEPSPLTVLDYDASSDDPRDDVYLPDSGPNASHTYDGLVWNPSTGTLWNTSTAIGFDQDNAARAPRDPSQKRVWEYDPETGDWTGHDATSNMIFGNAAFLDSRDAVFTVNNPSHDDAYAFLYDAEGNETVLGEISGPTGSHVSNVFQNPTTGALYRASSSGILELTVTDDGVEGVKIASFPGIEDLGIAFDFKQAAYAYRPTDGKFYIWDGGREVVTWDPATGAFEVHWNETSAIDGGTAVFDKFVYLDEIDAFAGITRPASGDGGGFWLYTPGPNPGDVDQVETGSASLDAQGQTSLGFFLPVLSGDKNFDARVDVSFRELGEDAWQDGQDLLRIRPEFVTTSHGIVESPAGFAGSVFGLKTGTDYEIQLETLDPDGLRDGAAPAVQTFVAATRAAPASTPATGRTIEVDDMAGLRQALSDPAAGDVILLAPGQYAGSLSVQASGTAENPIVVRAIDPARTVIDAHGQSVGVGIGGDHVRVEGLTVTGSDIGVKLTTSSTTTGVTIANNTIVNVREGIHAKGGHRELTITDNTVTGRRPFGETTTGGNDEGIVVTGQDIEVAHNTVSGFVDSIGLSHASSLPNIGIAIHHNAILWGADDGIEADFALRNVQLHDNLIMNHANGLSFQPVYGGPAYAFGNVIYNTERGPFKIKPEYDDPHGLVIAHNTSIKSGTAWTDHSGTVSNATIVNNLFVGQGTSEQVLVNGTRFLLSEIDHNAWSRDGRFDVDGEPAAANFAEWTRSGQFGSNDVLLAGRPIFDALPLDFDTSGFELYRDGRAADFGLDPDSAAVDAGIELANITGPVRGAAPDIGAFELGSEMPAYGVRSNAIQPDAPLLLGDAATVAVGETVALDVLANDFDSGGGLAVTGLTAPVNGHAEITAAGEVAYTPAAGFTGTDVFAYTATDGDGNAATATVEVRVLPPNAAPSAADDTLGQVVSGERLTVWIDDLLANDSDPNGDPLTIDRLGDPSHGTLSRDGGQLTYTPSATYVGADSFFYTVTDGRGGSSTASVHIEVLSDGTIVGGGNRDVIDLSSADRAHAIFGMGGHDIITGSPFADEIHGGSGSDRMDGHDGDDLFVAGEADGFDLVNGGAGFDTLRGSAGDDHFRLRSLQSIERLDAGAGDDLLQGSEDREVLDLSGTQVIGLERIDLAGGHDVLTASAADEHIRGGAGSDLIDGGGGYDTAVYDASRDAYDVVHHADGRMTVTNLVGDEDVDCLKAIEVLRFADGDLVIVEPSLAAPPGTSVEGGDNRDVIDRSPEPGPEAIYGHGGHDVITGTGGSDWIFGGTGSDRMWGGLGDDLFVLEADNGYDIVNGDAGWDTVRIADGVDSVHTRGLNGIERIEAESGAALLLGSEDREVFDFSDTELDGVALVDLGGGHDICTGSAGDDRIRGGAGHDEIVGGAGRDTAVFDFDLADYVVAQFASGKIGVQATVGDESTATLDHVELLAFADQTVSVNDLFFA
jgi:hypothetical protein